MWSGAEPRAPQPRPLSLDFWVGGVGGKTSKIDPNSRNGAKAFGQWEGRGIDTIQYAINNEIHHRGQGYAYLRALGVEPSPFWER